MDDSAQHRRNFTGHLRQALIRLGPRQQGQTQRGLPLTLGDGQSHLHAALSKPLHLENRSRAVESPWSGKRETEEVGDLWFVEVRTMHHRTSGRRSTGEGGSLTWGQPVRVAKAASFRVPFSQFLSSSSLELQIM